MKDLFKVVVVIVSMGSANSFAIDASNKMQNMGNDSSKAHGEKNSHYSAQSRVYVDGETLKWGTVGPDGTSTGKDAKEVADDAIAILNNSMEKICSGKLSPNNVSFELDLGVGSLKVNSDNPCDKQRAGEL